MYPGLKPWRNFCYFNALINVLNFGNKLWNWFTIKLYWKGTTNFFKHGKIFIYNYTELIIGFWLLKIKVSEGKFELVLNGFKIILNR